MHSPAPKIFIACDREAYIADGARSCASPFDRGIRWREEELSLCDGTHACRCRRRSGAHGDKRYRTPHRYGSPVRSAVLRCSRPAFQSTAAAISPGLAQKIFRWSDHNCLTASLPKASPCRAFLSAFSHRLHSECSRRSFLPRTGIHRLAHAVAGDAAARCRAHNHARQRQHRRGACRRRPSRWCASAARARQRKGDHGLFFSVALGLACGMGYVAIAGLFFVIISLFLLLLERFPGRTVRRAPAQDHHPGEPWTTTVCLTTCSTEIHARARAYPRAHHQHGHAL